MLYRPWMGRIAQSDLVEFTAEVLAAVLPGSATLRAAIRSGPDHAALGAGGGEEILRAFVTTVVPCVSPTEPDLLRAFHDPAYSFEEYRDLLVYDLAVRSARTGGGEPFTQLSRAARRRVIREALAADGSVQRLYRGAIFLAQASIYGGLYEEADRPYERLLARPA